MSETYTIEFVDGATVEVEGTRLLIEAGMIFISCTDGDIWQAREVVVRKVTKRQERDSLVMEIGHSTK